VLSLKKSICFSGETFVDAKQCPYAYYSLMPVALVTGASRGLGKEIAFALAKNGYAVFVNYLSADKETSELIRSIGRDAHSIRADVGDAAQVRAMADLIEKESGRLDVVINNAGITKDSLLIKQSEKEWDSIIATNLKGCFNIIKTMAPLMVKSGGGHIVNISSRSGVCGKAGQTAYSASKAALLGLTYTCAAELAVHNIRVNTVLPGFMMTDMGMGAGTAMEQAVGKSMLHRLSDPAEVAALVLSIVQTQNITGQVFSLDSRLL
jgi:3-oxoacyl-[acyl-carrier protein] reductase